MKYKIVESTTLQDLQDDVNGYIGSGYCPIGGVSVSVSFWQSENERKGYTESGNDYIYAQALLHD